jgi:hypothetical protein
MCSLWRAWISQSRNNAQDPNFTPEFIADFRTLLKDAFESGRAFASQNPKSPIRLIPPIAAIPVKFEV